MLVTQKHTWSTDWSLRFPNLLVSSCHMNWAPWFKSKGKDHFISPFRDILTNNRRQNASSSALRQHHRCPFFVPQKPGPIGGKIRLEGFFLKSVYIKVATLRCFFHWLTGFPLLNWKYWFVVSKDVVFSRGYSQRCGNHVGRANQVSWGIQSAPCYLMMRPPGGREPRTNILTMDFFQLFSLSSPLPGEMIDSLTNMFQMWLKPTIYKVGPLPVIRGGLTTISRVIYITPGLLYPFISGHLKRAP